MKTERPCRACADGPACPADAPDYAAKHRPLAPGTIRLYFIAVRAFYQWHVAEGNIEVDPTAGIEAPTVKDDGRPTPTIKREPMRELLAVPGEGFLPRRDAALLLVFFDAGLRLEECTALQLDDVDVGSGALIVRGKYGRMRLVQLGARTRRALDRYLMARRKERHAALPDLWICYRGALSYAGMRATIMRHGRRVGLHVHPHMLRHTWASEAKKAGVSEGDMMTLGGWKTPAMVHHYGRDAAEERARESYRRLSVADRLR